MGGAIQSGKKMIGGTAEDEENLCQAIILEAGKDECISEEQLDKYDTATHTRFDDTGNISSIEKMPVYSQQRQQQQQSNNNNLSPNASSSSSSSSNNNWPPSFLTDYNNITYTFIEDDYYDPGNYIYKDKNDQSHTFDNTQIKQLLSQQQQKVNKLNQKAIGKGLFNLPSNQPTSSSQTTATMSNNGKEWSPQNNYGYDMGSTTTSPSSSSSSSSSNSSFGFSSSHPDAYHQISSAFSPYKTTTSPSSSSSSSSSSYHKGGSYYSVKNDLSKKLYRSETGQTNELRGGKSRKIKITKKGHHKNNKNNKSKNKKSKKGKSKKMKNKQNKTKKM